MAMSPLRVVETTALHLGYELGDPRHADIAERIVALSSISVPAITLAGVCKGRHLGRSSRHPMVASPSRGSAARIQLGSAGLRLTPRLCGIDVFCSSRCWSTSFGRVVAPPLALRLLGGVFPFRRIR